MMLFALGNRFRCEWVVWAVFVGWVAVGGLHSSFPLPSYRRRRSSNVIISVNDTFEVGWVADWLCRTDVRS